MERLCFATNTLTRDIGCDRCKMNINARHGYERYTRSSEISGSTYCHQKWKRTHFRTGTATVRGRFNEVPQSSTTAKVTSEDIVKWMLTLNDEKQRVAWLRAICEEDRQKSLKMLARYKYITNGQVKDWEASFFKGAASFANLAPVCCVLQPTKTSKKRK